MIVAKSGQGRGVMGAIDGSPQRSRGTGGDFRAQRVSAQNRLQAVSDARVAGQHEYKAPKDPGRSYRKDRINSDARLHSKR